MKKQSYTTDFLIGLPNLAPFWRVWVKHITKKNTDVQKVRKQKKIFADAQEIFEQVLATHGWRQVEDPRLNVSLEPIDHWIAQRIASGASTRFYACFVEDAQGKRHFLKVLLHDQAETSHALQIEGLLLAKGMDGVTTPRNTYCATDGDMRMYVCTEAIPLEEGNVVTPKEWSRAHIRSVIQQIHALERFDIGQVHTTLQSLPNFSGYVNVVRALTDLTTRAGSWIPADLRQRMECFVQEVNVPAVLVHGDLWVNNILFRTNSQPCLIDWEMAGKGFLGQDAGKLLHELAPKGKRRNYYISSYINRTDILPQQALAGLFSGYILENLIHLVWRLEGMIYTKELLEMPSFYKECAAYVKTIQRGLDEYSMYQAMLAPMMRPEPEFLVPVLSEHQGF